MSNTERTLLIYGTAGLGLYFFVAKPLLEKLGLQKSSEETAQDRQNAAERDKYVQDAVNKPDKTQNNAGKPTQPAGYWTLKADQLWEYLRYSSISDDKIKAAQIFNEVKNDADMALLLKAFGKRKEYAFGLPIGGAKSLPEFVTGNLKPTTIQLLNTRWKNLKMKFRF